MRGNRATRRHNENSLTRTGNKQKHPQGHGESNKKFQGGTWLQQLLSVDKRCSWTATTPWEGRLARTPNGNTDESHEAKQV